MDKDKGTNFAVNAGSLNGIVEKLKEAAQSEAVVFDCEGERFTISKVVPERTVALAIGGVAIAHLGNVIGITGQMKSGKTGVTTALVKAFLTGAEVLGFTVPITGNVVYIDTEQADIDTKERIYINAVKHVNGGTGDLPTLYTYNLRGQALGDMQPITAQILDYTKPALLIIDGLADYVLSVNDEVGSKTVIAWLLACAKKYNCLVVAVLHDNHNTEKSRGHLGSELDRKSETVLRLEKEKATGVISVLGKFYRSAGDNTPIIQFAWNEEQGGFEFLQHIDKTGVAMAKMQDEAAAVIGAIKWGGGLTYTETAAAIAGQMGKGERTAKGRVTAWQKSGLLLKTNAGLYLPSNLEEAPF